ncbi:MULTISPECIES: protease modulator HflC [unclassified Hydrogenophaga]|jgi:membrane protease subunit HflC|uniref:protease modulator HflC n=1 Tax=unclassified Hydrogenophaga TaxID=2610897 RepID=UPI00098610D1|nr:MULTISPECIES: protease modulator HflC [unclassified Hydrogenophaga]MBT9553862.1 protease modulator HflC [Hydrogenophaga sp.]OOG85470.1 HflC protein [Hydrogenophaga sp. A37]UJW82864.1 protease modulator HflC [Hydrogenophaga sp. SL48]
MNKLGFIATSILVALAFLSATFFVVDQRQFGVVFQLGEIKKVVTEPGLGWKIPLVQNVSYIDKRLLTLESSDTEPTLTAEKQRVVIDWYVRWRISEPQQYIRNVGLNESAGALQLNRVVRNSFQQEVNKRTLNELLSTRREQLMEDVKREVLLAVKGAEQPWGMDVVDVRITRVDYAESITASVYQRMETERKRVANELRSTGFAEGEKIRADADRQREVILAEAYKQAQTIKGEADAKAAGLYGEAFGRDPAFAQFYRSLEAYKASFAGKSDVMVIDPSSDFFKAMRSSNVAR